MRGVRCGQRWGWLNEITSNVVLCGGYLGEKAWINLLDRGILRERFPSLIVSNALYDVWSYCQADISNLFDCEGVVQVLFVF